MSDLHLSQIEEILDVLYYNILRIYCNTSLKFAIVLLTNFTPSSLVKCLSLCFIKTEVALPIPNFIK